ncbi:MAG: hypothetical protein IJY39_14435 [Clostridia bacterium]|nr:hypothetical protein [Clostridia bacterium]
MAAMCLSACEKQNTDATDTVDTLVTESTARTENTTEIVTDTQATEAATETETEVETETVSAYVNEPDSGEGYQHILLDRKFDLGFGCEWNLGKQYTLNTGLKQGSVTYYQDIGKPFYVVPQGLATKGEAQGGLIASSGLEDNVYWQFEEGYKKHFVDATGKGPYELQDHRIVVNSTVVRNDENRLLIRQYNDYLHETYPQQYPESDPLLVKSIDSNREGKIVFSYNSYNDISNTAYAYSSEFAEDTWPHLLLHQTFAEPVDLAKYSSIEFSMTVKVNRADQINTWPQGKSDRYDQPAPPAGAPVSPSETTLQTYFFIRSKKSPHTLGAFVGIMISSSNESLRREHLGIEQNGIDFYRIDLGNKNGKRFDLEGEWLGVGDKTTLKVDLIKYLEYVLEEKFDNENPESKWYGVGVDDVFLSFFNMGYEYIGNWDCEYELSNVYARGVIKEGYVEEDITVDDRRWYACVDQFEYSADGNLGNPERIVNVATNNVNGTTATGTSGRYSEIAAKSIHLKGGWLAVDGYEIERFTCKIYGADGSLLNTVSCGLYGADDGVINHVATNLGYGEGTVAHRFNGNPDMIDLSKYAGQTVTVVYEVGLAQTEDVIELIKLNVNVPANE